MESNKPHMAKQNLNNLKKIPTHLAIIMDGNGRWAQQKGLPRVSGHRAGTENLREVIEAAVEFGIQYLTIFAFSTENWTRPSDGDPGIDENIQDDAGPGVDEPA